MDTLIVEATRLINDLDYRIMCGEAMNSCVISAEEFNQSFKDSVEIGKSQDPMAIDKEVKIHDLNVEDKLRLENKTRDYQRFFYMTFGGCGLFVSPKMWCSGFKARIINSRMGTLFKFLYIVYY